MIEKTNLCNPFVKYSTLEEAQTALDFEIKVPETPEDYELVSIQVMSKEMLQLSYKDNESSVIYRMQTTEKSIDGVYKDFLVIEEDIDGKTITFKGDGGVYEVATWLDGVFTYAIVCIRGVTKDLFVSMIKSIK